jgi:hypothetical protein
MIGEGDVPPAAEPLHDYADVRIPVQQPDGQTESWTRAIALPATTSRCVSQCRLGHGRFVAPVE